MDNKSMYGYLQFSFDSMYIYGNPLTDKQREEIFNFLYQALDIMTEEEAKEYYETSSNTNIKEV